MGKPWREIRPWQPKQGTWYSRGYIPHRDEPGLIQGITFHLGDSLPQSVLSRLQEELAVYEESLRRHDRKGDLQRIFHRFCPEFR